VTLATGTRLGPHEILAAIGAGGMGEVYQAHDTKLGRDVAIKVLPEAFAHDPERLSRFQREAKMLAALNHPAIATIYGLEQTNGTSYLVMELVSGETLQQRVAREGRLPVEEALGICRQMADALEAAHEKGIIHRDLKPANVKVTPEGKVKVLDFGLAKAFAGGESGSDPSNSPTLSAAATMQGVILGTAAYMSPEQARGKAVDKRADIWAFGCVLYELLTGQQAFQGDTVTEIFAAVLRGEPDWPALPAATPTNVRALLRRCLQKDRTLRERDAGDAGIEIQEALTAPSVGPTVTGPAEGSWRQATVLGLAVLVTAVVAGLAGWKVRPAPPGPRPVTRFTITLPPGQQLSVTRAGPAVALSPDGSYLAYAATLAGTLKLYLRAMSSLDARPVPGTEGGRTPFFSPDGQALGFFVGGKLKKVSMSGGAALSLADATIYPIGASWGSQGIIAFAPGIGAGLQQVSDMGGPPQPLTRLKKGEVGQGEPEFLPDGKAVLFTAGALDVHQVAVQPIGGERRDLIRGAQPRYAHSGHLVYVQEGTLMAAPFDPQRLTVTGPSVPMVENVEQDRADGAAQYNVSSTGSLVYVRGNGQQVPGRLVWVDRQGRERALPAPARAYAYPNLSPAGERLTVTIADPDQGLWVLHDLARDTLSKLTFQGINNEAGVWTPDGKRITFASTKEGAARSLFWQWADGSGGLEPLTSSEYPMLANCWSSDGQRLAFSELNPDTGWDIWVLRISDHQVRPFLNSRSNETAAQFSPDGQWLAYSSDESGRNEIYVRPYPGPGGQWQLSTGGGTEPLWNRNGREVFYRSGNALMAVDITTQSGFTHGTPGKLFEGEYVKGISHAYDVSPDGQRFLMIKATEQAQAAPTQINVVLNWFEELKQKVPAGPKE
jgi:Tol biopolymer transport system component